MNTLKMLGIVIFYTVLLSTVFSINGLRDSQLDAVARLLETHSNVKSSSSEESSEGDDAHSRLEHNLKNLDLLHLIQQANKIKKAQNYNENRFRADSNFLDQIYQNSQYKTNNNNNGKNRLLGYIFNQEKKPFKNTYHERLVPNRLLSPNQYAFENEDRGSKGDSNDFSKIYVIMDPFAILKSRNTEDLPNLLSRILASSVADKNSQDRSNILYKGFVVKDNSKSRRFRRESKEMYAGDDDDFRPKRNRNDHNKGGGAGGGGRTAIPYIRHRGDIYERDH